MKIFGLNISGSDEGIRPVVEKKYEISVDKIVYLLGIKEQVIKFEVRSEERKLIITTKGFY